MWCVRRRWARARTAWYQALGFVVAGLSGGGGGCLWLFVAVGVGCPGVFVLGGGSRADGGVWPGGARTSGPARRWRPRVASMSCQGPWLRMSSALYKELERLGQGKAERSRPSTPTEATASQSDRACP